MILDLAAVQHIHFQLTGIFAISLDYRFYFAYSARKVDQSYHYGNSNSNFIEIMLTADDRDVQFWQTVEYQPNLDVSATRRTLDSAAKEKDMSTAYRFFFAISQLGGLYSFMIMALGFLMRLLYDKLFQIEAINILNFTNKVEFAKLEEKLKRHQAKVEPRNIVTDINPRKKHFSKSEVPSQRKRKNGESSEVRANSKLPRGATVILNRDGPEEQHQKQGKLQKSTSQASNTSQDAKFSNPQVVVDKQDQSQKLNRHIMDTVKEYQRAHYYNLSDLIYNIFFCFKIRSNEGTSVYDDNKNFEKDLACFSEKRDLVKIISQIEELQYRMNDVEMKLSLSSADVFNAPSQVPAEPFTNSPSNQHKVDSQRKPDSEAQVEPKKTHKKRHHKSSRKKRDKRRKKTEEAKERESGVMKSASDELINKASESPQLNIAPE